MSTACGNVKASIIDLTGSTDHKQEPAMQIDVLKRAFSPFHGKNA